MNKEIVRIKDLDYLKNIDLLISLVQTKQDKAPNAVLDKMAVALKDIFYYVNSLQMDRAAYTEAMSQFRSARNNAELRNKNLLIEVEKLKGNIETLNQINN